MRSGTDPAGASPRVWLVVGEKRGDNAQIRNLAGAVGWAFEEKSIQVVPKWVDAKPRVSATLDHIDASQSDLLEGPWPDLVITAGRRLASVALWIKQASGGRTRLVVIGKPRGRAADFDLIVIAAHYVMRDAPNLLRHALPLMPVDLAALGEARKAWEGRLGSLPRPLAALMVGGPTGGLRFDVEAARALLAKTQALVESNRGSLYIATSRRTPRDITQWLRETCSASVQLSLYDPDASPEENPYQGLLALADQFVVTSDSLSMMVEVARLGRPLWIDPLERELGAVEGICCALGVMKRLSPRTDSIPAGGLASRIFAALGWPIHSRDLSAISRLLVEQARASWLGEPGGQPRIYADDTREEVAHRIRALVE